jgi:hypothetical protein
VNAALKASDSIIRTKWKQWEKSVSKLISDRNDKSEQDYGVQLEPDTYEQCVRLADQHGVSVDAIVNHALEQYIAGRPNQYQGRSTIERLDKNPIFHLDALIGRKNNMNDGDYRYE